MGQILINYVSLFVVPIIIGVFVRFFCRHMKRAYLVTDSIVVKMEYCTIIVAVSIYCLLLSNFTSSKHISQKGLGAHLAHNAYKKQAGVHNPGPCP